jgi:hypothetical protein
MIAFGGNWGWEVSLLVAIPSALATGLAAALMVALAVWYYTVYVAADGLKCYDFWGIYHFVPWDTIKEARTVNLFWLRYLRVSSPATPRPLYVPLFLADMPGFCAAVADRAGPDHPLTEALAEYRP